MTPQAPVPAFRHFKVSPLTPVIGAVIEGLHLADLDDASAAELRQAVWQHGVVFVRAQHLRPDQMKKVALHFGEELEKHGFGKTLADQGHPEVLLIESYKSDKAKTTTDIWHHDVTARRHPNIMSILQAEQVPFGTDTMWASATAAYDRLPYALKLLFLNLDIDHDTVFMALRHDFGDASTAVEKLLRLGEASTHPAVIDHPFTGRPCLFVGNGYVKRVHGYSAETSEALLRIANDMVRVPELQVRYAWGPGDVAIWDNFGTVHYGVTADLGDQVRRLHRVAAWSRQVTPSLDRERAVRKLMQAQA
jgi:alpha-ketoglutarate-dependent taurine dioxygenase